MKISAILAVAALAVGIVLLALAPSKTREIIRAREEVRSKAQAMMDAKSKRDGRDYGRFEDDVLGKTAAAVVAVDIFIFYTLPAGLIVVGLVLLLIPRCRKHVRSRTE
jgi:Flp pilus assembly protein TadB